MCCVYVCVCRVPILAWGDAPEASPSQQDASGADSLAGDGEEGQELDDEATAWQEEEAPQQHQQYQPDYNGDGELLSLSGVSA